MSPRLHSAETTATPPAALDESLTRARRLVEALFGPPGRRSFTVRYWNGSEEAPGIVPESGFTLWFRRPGALRRMLVPPSELSITEAFIAGDVELLGDAEQAMQLGDAIGARIQSIEGIAALLPILVALPRDDESSGFVAARRSRFAHRAHDRFRIEGGVDAIQHHYDAGNEFYGLWLDERMVYSCAYFRDPGESLAAAQLNKLDLICRKLHLEPGMRLLDIGCGWGALIMHAAANYGVYATGITLSQAQASLARERIEAAGLPSTCRVELRDYRELTRDEEFDRVASVGMMEHVGDGRLPGYFSLVHRVLRSGGLFLNHAIVRDGHRPDPSARSRILSKLWKRGEFIHRHVFPDGQLVPVAQVVDRAERAGFELHDVEAMRAHYILTLRHWLNRLEANRLDAIALVGERRYRTWKLYLLAAINGFRAGNTNIVQALFAKGGGDSEVPLPLARDL
jgi:cyclopropane-fatty-acyl-phospholipid synthase